jgi:hypothetical protein
MCCPTMPDAKRAVRAFVILAAPTFHPLRAIAASLNTGESENGNAF